MTITESMYYILLSLLEPNHGYGIIHKVQKITKERLILGAGTLYGAINTLLEKEMIELYSVEKESRKKKEYIITDKGKKAIENEIFRLKELLENGNREIEKNG